MKRRRVSRIEYRKFIKGLSLKELKMVFLNAAVEENFMPPAELKIQDVASYNLSNSDQITILHKYIIKGARKDVEKAGFDVEVHYKLRYTATVPMTTAIFSIFAKSSLRLHTWPYFRQLVHQLTLNMNLPPMILDTIKIPS